MKITVRDRPVEISGEGKGLRRPRALIQSGLDK
jgi:hypothetical protein